MSIITISQLSKSYKISKSNEQQVFERLHLTIKEPGMVAIVGESGGGKSTLMNIIGGMDSEYEGTVLVDNQDLKAINLDDYRKNRLGFIFQSFNLIPNLTVIENVELAMDLTRKTKEEKKEIALNILTKVGLKEHSHKNPTQLSGGQKQRVAIARSLVNNPEIILADEPTGALDKITSIEIMELLKDIASEGKLILIVTHSDRVSQACDRIIRIDDGKIVEDTIQHTSTNPFVKIEKSQKNLSFLASLKFSIKNVIRNKKRNLLVSLGGSIGIFSVVLVLGLSSGIKGYLYDELVGKTDTLNVAATKGTSFGPGADNIDQTQFQFSTAEIKELSEINGVTDYETNSTIQGNSSIKLGAKQTPLMMVTSDLSQVEKIVHGDMPKANEVLLTEKTASSLLDENEKMETLVGKEVSLSLAIGDQVIKKTLTISGIAKPNSSILNSIAIGLLSEGELESIYKENSLEYKPTTVILRAKDENTAPKISDALKKLGYKGSAMEGAIEQINQYLSLATIILAGIASVSLIVSSIMILVVMYISVVERTKEIGVLRAIGARKKDIQRMFISESGIIGFISGTIGVVSAILVSIGVNTLMYQMMEIRIIEISPIYILIGILVSVLVSVIAGYSPASRAAKLDPIESLRYE